VLELIWKSVSIAFIKFETMAKLRPRPHALIPANIYVHTYIGAIN